MEDRGAGTEGASGQTPAIPRIPRPEITWPLVPSREIEQVPDARAACPTLWLDRSGDVLPRRSLQERQILGAPDAPLEGRAQSAQ